VPAKKEATFLLDTDTLFKSVRNKLLERGKEPAVIVAVWVIRPDPWSIDETLQREACEAYIKSQAHEGWRLIPGRYDDGAFSGASLDRPALQQLLAEVRAGKIDIVLVYKVDRLTRSLADFAKLIELFDAHDVSFVSVTQSFNTSSSRGAGARQDRCL